MRLYRATVRLHIYIYREKIDACETYHKRGLSKGYTMQFKKGVIEYSSENSNWNAARNLRLTRNEPEWKSQKKGIKSTNPKKQRLAEEGRKLTYNDLEENLSATIFDCIINSPHVSRKIMFKAKSMFDKNNFPSFVRCFTGIHLLFLYM